MHSQLENHPKAVGARQTVRALRAGNAARIYLARDAAPAVTGPIEDLSRELSVEAVWVGSMRELGQACGITVGAAVAADLRS